MHLRHRKEKQEDESHEEQPSSSADRQKQWEAQNTSDNYHFGTTSYYMILENRNVQLAEKIIQAHCGAKADNHRHTGIFEFL